MKKQLKTLAPVAIIAALVVGFLSACTVEDTATPTSMCAFRIGDGKDGRDAKIKEVAFPGDLIDRDTNDSGDYEDVVYYFPCNARNYIVNDGKQTDVSENKVGDRFIAATGYTRSGTKVKVYYTMYWTLNQTEKVLTDSFYPFCYKYTCYSDDQSAGNANFSSDGWNGMLAENFPQAADAVVLEHSKTVLTDKSWREHDTAEWDALAKQLSENFAGEIRANTGIADDMFCGSGNSGWKDPNKPGEGAFTCTNVRFKVTSIVSYSEGQQEIADGQSTADLQSVENARLLAAAKAKYGAGAGYWLGMQDTLDKCAKSNITCVVSFGSGNAPNVTLPAPKSE